LHNRLQNYKKYFKLLYAKSIRRLCFGCFWCGFVRDSFEMRSGHFSFLPIPMRTWGDFALFWYLFRAFFVSVLVLFAFVEKCK